MKSRVSTKNEAPTQTDAVAGLVRVPLSRDRLPERPTPEQIAALSAVREAWLQAGLSTRTADRAEAEAGVHDAYREAQLDPPDRILWLASPLQGVMAAAQLWRQDDDLVRFQIWDPVNNLNRHWIWAQIAAQVGRPIQDEIEEKIGWLVGSQVLDQVPHELLKIVLYLGGGKYLLRRQLEIGGSQEVYWLSFHDAVDKTVGHSHVLPLPRGLMRVARSAGWWWPFKKIAILTDRPCVLQRDAQNRLHSDDGPALSYRDGFSVYASHGTRVPDWVIERPQDITPDLIDAETNSEVRRVMVEHYKRDEVVSGVAAYIRDAGGDLLDDDPRWGRLYRRHRPGEDNLVLVQVPNATPEPDGSVKEYWLRVHPKCRPMTLGAGGSVSLGRRQKLTALNAIASTFGFTGAEYARLSMES